MMATNHTRSKGAATPDSAGHPDELELASYLDGGGGEHRALIERHLIDCADCRQALLDAGALLHAGGRDIGESDGSRRTGVRAPRAWLGLAAAAVFAAVLVPRAMPTGDPKGLERAVTRSSGRAAIAVVSPVEGGTLDGDQRLTWRAVNATQYRVSLLSDKGEQLLTAESSDTTMRLPAAIRLRAGETYFWVVDAIVDGTLVSSGHHALVGR